MNKYYSGQGTLYVGERDAFGKPQGLVSVGNVPTLEISIDVTKFEHNESESGNRSIDLTLIQALNASFNAVLESLSSANLALGFFGESAVVTGAAVADEAVTIDTKDVVYPLAHINLDDTVNPSVEDSGANAMTEDTDYSIDYKHGTITVLSGGTVPASLPDTIKVSYTYLDYLKMSAFTVTTVERYLRFHGINTVDEDTVIVDIFRASINPAQNFGLINEDIGSLTLEGTILRDSLNASSGSEFFTERRIDTTSG